MSKNIIILIFVLLCASSTKAQNIERYKDYHDKGRLLILEGKYQEAISQLDTAIHIMPYYARIFQDRGYAYMQIKKYDAALRDFEHVLNKQPYLNEVRLQRGMALYHLNHMADAEADLLKVSQANPRKNYEASYYLENIQRIKEYQQAKDQEHIERLKYQTEMRRLERARHRENVIWNTVVPLAFWTSVFLTW